LGKQERWEKKAEKFTIDYANQCALELEDYATKLLKKKTPMLRIKTLLILKHQERTKDSDDDESSPKLNECADYSTKIANVMSSEIMDALEYRLKGIEQRTGGAIECTHEKVYDTCKQMLGGIVKMVGGGMLDVMNAKMNGYVENAILNLLEKKKAGVVRF
jgi:hypothetical protein